MKATAKKTRRKPDAYDKMVAWLRKRPGMIEFAWGDPHYHRCGALFARVQNHPSSCAGCLTQIRMGNYDAETPSLTLAIRADERIPESGFDVTRAHLPLFARWQRRIDKELGRTPPVWKGEA